MERRDVNNHVDYLEDLRNLYIDRQGILFQILQPMIENKLDLFGDLDSVYSDPETVRGVPQYDKYYELLGLYGPSIEMDNPLHVLVRTDLHIKRDTLVRIPRPNALDDEHTFLYWRVIGSEIKHLGKIYGKFLKCVPERNFKWTESGEKIIVQDENHIVEENQVPILALTEEDINDIINDL